MRIHRKQSGYYDKGFGSMIYQDSDFGGFGADQTLPGDSSGSMSFMTVTEAGDSNPPAQFLAPQLEGSTPADGTKNWMDMARDAYSIDINDDVSAIQAGIDVYMANNLADAPFILSGLLDVSNNLIEIIPAGTEVQIPSVDANWNLIPDTSQNAVDESGNSVPPTITAEEGSSGFTKVFNKIISNPNVKKALSQVIFSTALDVVGVKPPPINPVPRSYPTRVVRRTSPFASVNSFFSNFARYANKNPMIVFGGIGFTAVLIALILPKKHKAQIMQTMQQIPMVPQLMQMVPVQMVPAANPRKTRKRRRK